MAGVEPERVEPGVGVALGRALREHALGWDHRGRTGTGTWCVCDAFSSLSQPFTHSLPAPRAPSRCKQCSTPKKPSHRA